MADQPIRHVTAEMVEKRHREIAAEVAKRQAGGRRGGGPANGESTANGAMRVFRALWNFALRPRWNAAGEPGQAAETSMVPVAAPGTAGARRRAARLLRRRLRAAERDCPRFSAAAAVYRVAPARGHGAAMVRSRLRRAGDPAAGEAHQGRSPARPADVGFRARPAGGAARRRPRRGVRLSCGQPVGALRRAKISARAGGGSDRDQSIGARLETHVCHRRRVRRISRHWR